MGGPGVAELPWSGVRGGFRKEMGFGWAMEAGEGGDGLSAGGVHLGWRQKSAQHGQGAGQTGLAGEEGSPRGNWLEQHWALVTAG